MPGMVQYIVALPTQELPDDDREEPIIDDEKVIIDDDESSEIVIDDSAGVSLLETHDGRKLKVSLDKKPIDLEYTYDRNETALKKVNMPRKQLMVGRLIRSNRWRPIAEAIENRYGIPR